MNGTSVSAAVTSAFEQLAVQHGPAVGRADPDNTTVHGDNDHLQRHAALVIIAYLRPLSLALMLTTLRGARSTSLCSERGDAEEYRLLLKLVVPGELCSCIRADAIGESTDAAIRHEPDSRTCHPASRPLRLQSLYR